MCYQSKPVYMQFNKVHPYDEIALKLDGMKVFDFNFRFLNSVF